MHLFSILTFDFEKCRYYHMSYTIMLTGVKFEFNDNRNNLSIWYCEVEKLFYAIKMYLFSQLNKAQGPEMD